MPTKKVAKPLHALLVDVDTLVPDPKNARRHDDRNREAVAESLDRHGQLKPIVVQKQGMIVRAGNCTLEAAKALGWDQIAAVIVSMKDEEAQAFAIADNRTAELAEWDPDVLGAIMQEFHEEDIAALSFTPDDLAELGAAGWTDPEGDAELEDPETPEPPTNPVAKPGDLWELGRHRVLCGDCTDAAMISRVMESGRAVVTLTDPPYSVNYDRSQAERGGSTGAHAPYREADLDPTSVLGFMAHVPSDVMVWTYPVDRHFQALAKAYRDHGWELRRELVWTKNVFSFWPGSKYQQKHEPIMVATRNG